MNKTKLIDSLSEETLFSKKDIARVLDSLVRIVERCLKKGEKVKLICLGHTSNIDGVTIPAKQIIVAAGEGAKAALAAFDYIQKWK